MGWGGFLRATALATLLLGAGIVALLAAIDPYDSGRLTPAPHPGPPVVTPRLAHASRGRNPAFDLAVIGNSHLQLLAPARLTEATGFATVSLTVPAGGVAEQMAVMRWFLRHRVRPPAALVIGVDNMTCAAGTTPLQTHPFPFWLYGDATLGYLGGLFRSDTVEHAINRLRARWRGGPFGPVDGFDDYERLAPVDFRPGPGMPSLPLSRAPGPFAGIEMLLRGVMALPPETAVVLVVPPVYAGALPPPGSAEDEAGRACLAALRQGLAGRARTSILDFRVDDPMTRDATQFRDPGHHFGRMARRLEAAIVAQLRTDAAR